MGEYVKFKDEEIKIGTMESLYYATYLKYTDALKAGQLGRLNEDAPESYARADSGFRFRFPFPDEDKLPLGDIGRNDYFRGLPVIIDQEVIPYANGEKPFARKQYHMEITQQALVHRESDGKLCLALVWRDPITKDSYRIEDDNYIKAVLSQINKNHVAGETDPQKKDLYRQVALRILKGYRMEKPQLKTVPKTSKAIRPNVSRTRRGRGKGI